MSHVEQNREYWTTIAPRYAEAARRNWGGEPNWGVWGIPESELRILPDVAGLDAVELGCGTAYFSAWLTRLGARTVAVDVTPAQLETARAMQREHGLEFPLIEASAEDVPLPDASFDLVLSEYGASIWCDPYAWIPEAARLLRPAGLLVFLRNSTVQMLCVPEDGGVETTRLQRDYFGMRRLEWPDGAVEFHLPYGDWIRLLRGNGFEIERLEELQAPEGGTNRHDVDLEWARRWPAEEIWVARRER